MSNKNMICSSCGSRGQAKNAVKGSLLVELVMWLCFLLPGLIYSIWRLSSKQKVCRTCGASTLVPLDTPVGKDLAERYPVSMT